jgi:D-aminoacyl-tRNA deacylase
MKLIVIAKGNVVSARIGKLLKEKHKEIPPSQYFEIKDNVLDLDKYEKDFQKLKPELIIVPSTHKSEAGVPMLNAHSTGNWASADLGGKPNTLSIAPALYVRQGILEFQRLKSEKKALQKYEVGMEVTHHSPSIPFPVVFVEVGSSEKEWSDFAACEAAADVIYDLVTGDLEKVTVAIGFGGGHYAPQFNKRLSEGKTAFGHICPKYHADDLTEDTILQAFNKTIPKPAFAALEWKGLKSDQRKKITEILEKNKISWEKI